MASFRDDVRSRNQGYRCLALRTTVSRGVRLIFKYVALLSYRRRILPQQPIRRQMLHIGITSLLKFSQARKKGISDISSDMPWSSCHAVPALMDRARGSQPVLRYMLGWHCPAYGYHTLSWNQMQALIWEKQAGQTKNPPRPTPERISVLVFIRRARPAPHHGNCPRPQHRIYSATP